MVIILLVDLSCLDFAFHVLAQFWVEKDSLHEDVSYLWTHWNAELGYIKDNINETVLLAILASLCIPTIKDRTFTDHMRWVFVESTDHKGSGIQITVDVMHLDEVACAEIPVADFVD